jgi:serine phosphatase RsbU (regulator of sigma subunit)
VNPHAARSGAAPVPPTEHYRILLVEDDAGDALLVEEHLADSGLPHTLRWKRTLADGLTDVGLETPDCIVLDLGLPDVVGIAAVHALQTACPHAAVIVLTGLEEAASGTEAVAGGAQDYLVKGQVTADLLDRALRYAVHRKQAERAAAELRESQIYARENARLERGLLPAPLVADLDLRVTSRYLPGRQRALLGGDFLDVVQTSDGTVHAVIGDVSGHGPDEAALGVSLRITWRALVLGGHHGTDLLALMERVLVAERPRPEMFATCTTLTLDRAGATATVLLAGHHEPLLCSGGTARELKANLGPALGIAPGLRRGQPTPVTLPSDSALMLYTDGLVEGHSGAGSRRLGVSGLIDLIATAPAATADQLLDHLVTSAQALDAGRHSDDLAVLHLAW